MRIVDTHQHLWDLSKFTLAWHASEECRPLARNFLLKDYAEATEGLDVVKTIYMEVDVPARQQAAEANYVIDLCEQTDNHVVAAVISGRPGTNLFEPYVRRFAKSPHIKGVRDILYGKEPEYFLPEELAALEFAHGIDLQTILLSSEDKCASHCHKSEDGKSMMNRGFFSGSSIRAASLILCRQSVRRSRLCSGRH